MNPLVVWDQKRKLILINGQPIRGLTTGLLRDSFYPSYSRELATQGVEGPTEPQPFLSQFYPKGKPRTGAQRIRSAMQRGTRVHADIEIAFQLMREYRVPQREFGLPETRKHLKTKRVKASDAETVLHQYDTGTHTARQLKAAGVKYSRLLNRRNKHAQRLIGHWTHEEHLRIVATEVVVGIPQVCGTKVDVVLMNEDGQLVVGEIKTGSLRYLEKHTGVPMLTPFGDKTDAVLNQHLLQLAMGVDMYCETYRSLEARLTQPKLWYVTPTQVKCHPLPSWVSGRILEALCRLKR